MEIEQKEANSLAFNRVLAIILILSTIIGFIASLYAGIKPVIEIELGDDPPVASDFVAEGESAWFSGKYPKNFDEPGIYIYNLRTTWLVRPVVVRVKDPNAKSSDASSFLYTTACADEIMITDANNGAEFN